MKREQKQAEERVIKLGIIGAGLAIKWLHWPPLSRLKDRFKVVSIADISPDAAREVSELVGGSATTRDYRDLLSDPALEAVLISLPIHLSAQVLTESVHAGKHALCEKPVGSNLEQARRVASTLRGAPVVVQIAENFHYRRDLARVRELVAEGRIGKPFMIDVAGYYWTDTGKGFASTPWRWDSQYRGGAITDAAVHQTALLRELGGEIEQLQAFTKLVHPQLSGVDTMVLNVRYRSGVLGSLRFSAAARCTGSDYLNATIFGSEGLIQISEGKLRLKRTGSDEDLVEEYDPSEAYYDQLVNFYNAIVKGEPVVSTPEEALRDLEILMKAYDSAESRSVELLA